MLRGHYNKYISNAFFLTGYMYVKVALVHIFFSALHVSLCKSALDLY